MAYILLIVVFALIITQGKRITALEERMKAGTIHNTVPPKPAAQVALSESPQGSVVEDVPAVAASVTAHESVSSEEMSGRLLGRIGIAALVIGVSFLLKYAFDHDWIEPFGRVMLGIAIGLIMLGIGQWLRKKYLNYSDLLMGGGLAVLYLSVYAAYALYGFMDPIQTFLGLAVITAIGVCISIVNATRTLSMVAFIGGYVTPILIGVSMLGPWVVFTYLTILNAGVLGILMYKKWAPLVVVGLIGTWLHFGAWFMMSYKEDLLIPTLIFVFLQFLIFTAASVTRIIVEKRTADEIDYLTLTSTALLSAATAYHLLMPTYTHFVSLGSVLVAVFYGAIALVAYKENPQDRSINIFLPGLSVAFLTAAIPIEFSGPWISAWWFIESLVLYTVASKSSSRGFQVMGVVVYILGLARMFEYIFTYSQGPDYIIFFNGPFVLLALSIATAYAVAFIYFKYGSISAEIRTRGISAFVVIANVLTVYALSTQVLAYYDIQLRSSMSGESMGIQNSSNTSVSLLWALYAALLTAIGFAKKYPAVRRMGLVLFIITACKVVVDVWSLGELYRVISFIIFGIIALVASFMYVKYKDRLKEIV
jgi:uncharacterized membrane protein